MKEAESQPELSVSRTVVTVLVTTLTVGLTPLILYWACYGRVPNVTPPTAKELLKTAESHATLVDIKSPKEFDAVHIDGAQNWPLEDILSLRSLNEVPERFRNKTLLLISEGGTAGSSAAEHLMGIGLENVKNVRGGVQEWIGSVGGPEGGLFDRFKSTSGQTWSFPFRHLPWHEQLLTVINAFGIKPTYTILSLILVIILWRSRSPDLAALRWSMICFFLGENFCAANYIFFRDTSYLFEYFHSFGMLLSFGFTTYALLEGIDRRILMLSDPNRKCAALGLCRQCIKYENVPCGLRRAFFIIIPALAIVALMPLCSDLYSTSYNTMIFGTFYHYARRMIYQQFEMQYCPIATVALLTVSLLILTLKKENPLPLAKIFFAAGAGPLGFGMFRSILTGMYSQDLVWFAFWEESTELLFIMGVCFLLGIFRHQLLREPLI